MNEELDGSDGDKDSEPMDGLCATQNANLVLDNSAMIRKSILLGRLLTCKIAIRPKLPFYGRTVEHSTMSM